MNCLDYLRLMIDCAGSRLCPSMAAFLDRLRHISMTEGWNMSVPFRRLLQLQPKKLFIHPRSLLVFLYYI